MSKKRIITISAAMLSLVFMQGCIHKKEIVKPIEKPIEMTQFEKELSQASISASGAQDMLARVKNATSLSHLTRADIQQSQWQTRVKIKGLQEEVSLDWVGDVKGVVRALAKHMEGWQIDIYGKVPVTPPMVSIFKKKVTVQNILTDLGEQLGDRVDIIVNEFAEPKPQIKFIYLNETYDD